MSRAVPPAARIAAQLRAAALRLAGSRSAQLDAELLLAAVLGIGRGTLQAQADEVLDAAQTARFAALVERRAAGEPVAYLTGRRDFWTLTLAVTADVLVPRPETELLVERALALLGAGPADIADLGTGSGAVALALARERPAWRVVATDCSAAALSVARANAMRLDIGTVEFLQGDWCAPLARRRFGLIVSNPPYIAADDPALQDPALRCEPAQALCPGASGLEALAAIAAQARNHLEPGGYLLLEHGAGQRQTVARLLVSHGYAHVRCHPDLAGLDRVSEARSG
ncbi:MAG: peptide chain release factor N(5)-glutamine methyltransferase [Gammaproteobacteria bacterium]|nr:peptide chain release factor N(5)-glutamine methyltransferase [Gammaproteobacteria bacterium]